VTGQKCEDAETTFLVSEKTDQPLLCPDLINNCFDAEFGDQIQATCPITCGVECPVIPTGKTTVPPKVKIDVGTTEKPSITMELDGSGGTDTNTGNGDGTIPLPTNGSTKDGAPTDDPLATTPDPNSNADTSGSTKNDGLITVIVIIAAIILMIILVALWVWKFCGCGCCGGDKDDNRRGAGNPDAYARCSSSTDCCTGE
jgi:hypothetical protein